LAAARLAGIVLGATTVFVIDQEFKKAAAFALAGAALTFFGFIHGEGIAIAMSPAMAAAYLVIAGILLACPRYAGIVPHAADPHAEAHAEAVLEDAGGAAVMEA
jgi:AGZA family xanthine/uracil permease-like MFS transporter